MRKIIWIFFVLSTLISCYRKPLYLRGLPEPCDLMVTVTVSVRTNITLQTNIENSLEYDWDENLYGPLLYTLPDTVTGFFFNKRNYREISLIDTFVIDTPKVARILTDTNYDVLFYNRAYNSSYEHDFLYSHWLTYPFRESATRFDYSEEHRISFNSDQHYTCMISNMYIDTQNDDVPNEMVNGTLVYYYNVEAEITPMSYIYIVQVFIADDDPSIPMNVDSCLYLGISGVAEKGELFTQRTSGDRCVIESYNVKPRQTINSMYVFAERFVTFGLVDDYSYSWSNEDLKYELGIEFLLNDGTTKKGKVSITRLLKENPKGGVLNILLNNSDINKRQNTPNGGFDINIEGWQEEANVIVNI